MSKTNLELLDDYVGELVMYNGSNIRIKGYMQKNGTVQVKTNGSDLTVKPDQIPKLVDNFLPVEDEGPNEALTVYQEDKNQIEELEDIVMDNIKKVKEDPEYLPQAKQVNNNVNTMINIAKLKIDMVREVRKQGGKN